MAQNPKKRPGGAAAKPAPAKVEAEPVKEPVVEEPVVESEPESILIERRQAVATIPLSDPSADDMANAITLAFATAAEYIAAKVGDDHEIELEFVIGDYLFTAAVEENN
jgi:hypothetical protein